MTTSELFLIFFGGLIPLLATAFWLGRRQAMTWEGNGQRPMSRPGYYGWFLFFGSGGPAVVTALGFAVLHLAGLYSAPPMLLFAAALACGAGGLTWTLRRIHPKYNARRYVENTVRGLMWMSATLSILTTIGIVLSVLLEALRFFHQVGFWSFITGTEWEADSAFLIGAGRGDEGVAPPKFGAVPIFAGTFMITLIAMLVAVPFGLFSAIYLSEYAGKRLRAAAKPMLEILAGIPTVVYGFFAAITVSPLIVEIAHGLGLEADYVNALSPGIVMGIMIIPFVSSLSDDVIHAVPQALRDGSLALGMTRSETIRHVVLPAAMPGIVSAFLLAVSRAIGETMIVVMAAGLRPNLTWNPLEGMTTVTVKIVESLTGDQEFDSALTLSAFALGLVLLVVTLLLNIVSTYIIHRFKKQYALV
ncbi:MAG: phosphate ABC transporter permease subunit PstC [Gammaproteobacteria bacterium]|nr:MAG: phosphate ABC transporter permease subunit PstC [Gammaproteobacteria bacterium]